MKNNDKCTFRKEYLYVTICLLCIGFGISPIVQARNSTSDTRILSSNEKKMVLEYKPAAPSFTTFEENGQTITSIHIKNCETIFEKGKPILPGRTILVGIPPSCSRVAVTVVDLQYKDLDGYNILPAPEIKTDKKGLVVEKNYTKNPEIYSKDSFFPANLVEVKEPSWIRHQKVIDINLNPVRYNPVTGQLRIYEKVVVEIDFSRESGLKKSTSISTDPVFEKLYNSSILNYEIAKKWRFTVPRKLYKSNMLNFGLWYKLIVDKKGIYKLEYSVFSDAGLDSTSLPIDRLQIFYGGGRELSLQLSDSEPQLQEVATFVYDENDDGKLGIDDYVVFLGEGTSGWNYDPGSKSYAHYINHYTDRNIYWLSIKNGSRKKVKKQNNSRFSKYEPFRITKYRHRIFEEKEILNTEKSGIDWMWERFYRTMAKDYPIHISNISQNDSAALRVRVQGRTESHHNISFFLNGQFLQNVDLPYTLARTYELSVGHLLSDGENYLRIFHQVQSSVEDEIYFDWYELEYWRQLRAKNNELHFSSSGKYGVLEYHLMDFDSKGIYIFDTTNPFELSMLEYKVDDTTDNIVFRDSVGFNSERHYMAISKSQIDRISSLFPSNDPRSNLRLTSNSADYVIVTHESFKGNALDRLAAHRQDGRYWPYKSNPEVKIVTTEEIYDEFSWGLFDPAAIRNFLKYAYRNWRIAPSFVLLVGDACYDMKNNSGGSPQTFVPTFEDQLRATDDWFVCLDGDRKMDMFIGRLSVKSVDELNVVVDKIINYDSTPEYGPWKNTILLVADDKFSPAYIYDDFVFGRDTELLAADSVSNRFDIKKIYMDRYSKNAFGKKPKVKKDIIRNFNKGVLYVNFLGHGNYEVLTHEDAFYTPDDVNQLDNSSRLPLFFAGTCAVGQFDYDRKESMAEYLHLYPNGGCFSIIAGSRWNAHQFTSQINKEFYQNIFSRSGSTASIGQALTAAKMHSRYPDHRELLTLFGDPAQRLAIPSNTINFTISPDSIAPTKNVQIKGNITNGSNIAHDFSGYLFVKFYDNPLKRNETEYSYLITGRTLFEDRIRIDNGSFDANFFLRSDTVAGGSEGRVVVYAWDEGEKNDFPEDADGYLNSIYIISDTLYANTLIDSISPQVEAYINSIPLYLGEGNENAVPPSFIINFQVNDNFSGINVSQKSGYEITVVLDDKPETRQDITSSFQFIQDSNLGGSVPVSFNNLAVGEHSIHFSVWDNSLNHSTLEIDIVVEPEEIKIMNPVNYPNPASGYTAFTFYLTHDADVTIKVYTIVGRLIKTFHTFAQRGYNHFPEDNWDCTDQDGDIIANGVYLYKIIATRNQTTFGYRNNNQQSEAIEKLVILR